MPTRLPVSRLAALTSVAVMAAVVSACGEAPAPSTLPPSPVASRADAATPPPASQVAVDNSLGSWRSGPVFLDPAVEATIVAACRTAPTGTFGGGDPIGELPIAVVDARGLGRVTVVFAGEDRWAACLATVDETGAVTVTGAGQPGDADPAVGPVGDNDITIGALELLDDLDGGQRTVLIGRVGRNAFGTVSGFDDETYVDGQFANGWYSMWWPGNVQAASISAIDRGRVTIGAANPRQ